MTTAASSMRAADLVVATLRRYRTAIGLLAAMAALVACAKAFLAGRLIINRTDSVPRGVYWLSRDEPLVPSAIVAFPIPEPVRPLFRERRLVPSAFFSLLAKPVAAAAGDVVCVRSGQVFINGRSAATISLVDSLGRPMPSVSLCRALRAEELFVLTSPVASFDSRYFGPIHTRDVSGTLTLVHGF